MAFLTVEDDTPEEEAPRRGRRVGAEHVQLVEEPEAPQTRRVRVIGNFRVVHQGVPYVPGDVPEVPESLAQEWLLNRWVTDVK